MPNFDDREKSFEMKFANDQQMLFRAEARCAKLFGLWIAEKLGKGGDAARLYAAEMVEANLKIAGFDDILDKASADLTAAEAPLSREILAAKVENLFAQAKREIMTEAGAGDLGS